MRKVLILTDKKGWHFRQLKKAFLKKKFIVEDCNLSDLSIKIANQEISLNCIQKKITNYSDIIVRYIPGGTLEEIITSLNILKIFYANKINVINTAEQIECTVDKSMTSLILRNNNILTPNSYVIRNRLDAIKFIKNTINHTTLIYKPLFGSQGKDIVKISDISDFHKIKNDSNIYYFQDFLSTNPSHDYRVLVLKHGNTYKTYSMKRYGKNYINNFSQGAVCKLEKLNPQLINIAIKSAKALNIHFCGVDIIEFNNQFFVIEVNSIPAWKGLQSLIDDNIADQIVKIFLNQGDIKTSLSVI